jgi:hypothetical protein
MNNLKLKVSHNGTIKRIADTPESVNELKTQITQSFGTFEPEATLYYVDSDDDEIIIQDDSDFDVAKEYATQRSNRLKIHARGEATAPKSNEVSGITDSGVYIDSSLSSHLMGVEESAISKLQEAHSEDDEEEFHNPEFLQVESESVNESEIQEMQAELGEPKPDEPEVIVEEMMADLPDLGKSVADFEMNHVKANSPEKA